MIEFEGFESKPKAKLGDYVEIMGYEGEVLEVVEISGEKRVRKDSPVMESIMYECQHEETSEIFWGFEEDVRVLDEDELEDMREKSTGVQGMTVVLNYEEFLKQLREVESLEEVRDLGRLVDKPSKNNFSEINRLLDELSIIRDARTLLGDFDFMKDREGDIHQELLKLSEEE